jgi:hypothetical protein
MEGRVHVSLFRLVRFALVAMLGLLAVTGCAGSGGSTSTEVSAPDGPWVSVGGETGAATPPSNAVVFQRMDGGQRAFVPSGTGDMAWSTWSGSSEGYSFDYPQGWQLLETESETRAKLDLFPAGTDPGEVMPGGAQGITVAWTAGYAPLAADPTIAGRSPVTVEGNAGERYTEATLGAEVVAVFPWHNGHVVIRADAEQDQLIEVFLRLVQSLKFTS